MARQKSDFVSALGVAFEIFKAIAEEVYALGGTDNDIRRILKERTLCQQIAKLLAANVREGYLLNVYGHGINELVRQGRYDYANTNIRDGNFQPDQMHQTEFFLRHFGKVMSTDAVLRALDKDGLRPATMPELLEFGIYQPEVQTYFPIVALGSAWQNRDGMLRVGCLDCSCGQRILSLQFFNDDWGSSHRFAAVRK